MNLQFMLTHCWIPGIKTFCREQMQLLILRILVSQSGFFKLQVEYGLHIFLSDSVSGRHRFPLTAPEGFFFSSANVQVPNLIWKDIAAGIPGPCRGIVTVKNDSDEIFGFWVQLEVVVGGSTESSPSESEFSPFSPPSLSEESSASRPESVFRGRFSEFANSESAVRLSLAVSAAPAFACRSESATSSILSADWCARRAARRPWN